MALVVDSSVLFALLDRREKDHHWVARRLAGQTLPFRTSEPALTELGHLLWRNGRRIDAAMNLLAQGLVEAVPLMHIHADRMAELMRTYASVPMSIADASLVCLSELHPDHPVFTLDRDFLIYRRFRSEPIPLFDPPDRVHEEFADYDLGPPSPDHQTATRDQE